MKVPLPPPPTPELISEIFKESAERLAALFGSEISRLPHGEYPHWDKLRHLSAPEGFTHREWWAAIKLARRGTFHALPFSDNRANPFSYALPDRLLKLLHEIDRDASGRIELPEQVVNPQTRDRYLINSLMEESITSSQLEGAATTHQVAKEMLRQGRKPRNHGEQMIYNNYAAMQFIRSNKHLALSPELILQLQSMLTDSTLEDATASGRWRRADENVRVVDERNHEVLHVPPPADQLEDRVARLCAFANENNSQVFIHPVVRAIVLHFMIGYDHPFVDGNGRTARALFYWAMAKSGYWLIEFTSISRIIKKAPAQYARAYLHTETDENDVTYFLEHQLEVVASAITALHEYLAEKSREIADTRRLIASSPRLRGKLNHRQLATLDRLLNHSGSVSRIQQHQTANNVTYETARTDLLEMVELGLLSKHTEGKSFVFSLARKLQEQSTKKSRV